MRCGWLTVDMLNDSFTGLIYRKVQGHECKKEKPMMR
jgi:hypothetical protein